MKTRARITDFGNKIGGAKKDWWLSGNFTTDELNALSLAQRKKCASKAWLWPPCPVEDLQAAVNAGADRFVLYWKRTIRRLAFPMPIIKSAETSSDEIIAYVNEMISLRKTIREIKTRTEVNDFYSKAASFCHVIDAKTLLSVAHRHDRMFIQMQNTNFPFGSKDSEPKDKKKNKRKPSFVPPKLLEIKRSGEDYRKGMQIDEFLWQRQFNSWGVEFGRWLTEKDKQASLNYCYDAFMDLAVALDIRDEDISFNHKLSMAFGSRGSCRASAHYEPLNHVINLTKMHGAGCTAHEWFHALDNLMAETYGVTDTVMASESKQYDKLPEEFVKLIRAMQHDADGTETEFLKGSREFGKHYAKDAHGYWDSKCEMAARAFGCYIKDTVGVSDYLIAHADSYVFETENERACAIPQDEERELFNELFDYLFVRLKHDKVLAKRPPKKKKRRFIEKGEYPFKLIPDKTGQLHFPLT